MTIQNESRTIFDHLRRLVHAIYVGSKSLESSLKISGAQLFIMKTVGAIEPCSINEIAEEMLAHQSTISISIGRLVSKGWLASVGDPQDKRRVVIKVTRAGRQILKRAPLTIQEQLAKSIRALPPTERRQLATILTELLRQMGIESNEATLFLETSSPKPKKVSVKPARTSRLKIL